jgi:hypothetical protein
MGPLAGCRGQLEENTDKKSIEKIMMMVYLL